MPNSYRDFKWDNYTYISMGEWFDKDTECKMVIPPFCLGPDADGTEDIDRWCCIMSGLRKGRGDEETCCMDEFKLELKDE